MESSNSFNFTEMVKEHQKNKKLVASELGELFANYQGDSVYYCVFEHFMEVVEDKDIKEFITYAKGLPQKHWQRISSL
ncbi:DUF3231 family protein [Bacillus sp. AK031]